ncbi:hypothetical protein J3R82DRAFT_8553 [Butyriboletus roseoflavus]|nr:hypothetical protein J3R82DRAFT_8553 [Butyriboletus roseoflavus]
MVPNRIRLIRLKTRTVSWHAVDVIPWDKVWTITHIWDTGGETTIPLKGISWMSTSFSSENRFNVMFEKTCQLVEPRGAEYVWIDAACIHQQSDDEKKEQVPFMGTIYSKSAGAIAFGTLSPKDRFVEITSTYDDGRKAWVCDWFERVWTFQELQLPKVLLFVSGDHVLTRNEIYLSILMMSPYLTSPHQSPPSRLNDPHLSIQDVVNALSPLSRSNTQRALMQTSRRGCSSCHVHDKVYGILGVLAQPYSKLKVDYKTALEQALLDLMKLMPPNDVLDTLMFNTLPPVDKIHDGVHWSGMIMLDRPTEHPSYETDIHHSTNALVVVTGKPPRATTVVYDATLWEVVVTKPENTHADVSNTHVRAWPSIAAFSQYAKLTDDFSKVERSAHYASAVGRAERSLAANRTMLEPLLEKSTHGSGSVDDISYILQNPPSRTEPGGIPPNRLGDASLFDQKVTMLVCRSKADNSFHYGIVVMPSEDGTRTWHKVCTAAFSDSCVVAAKARAESKVVIGR